MSELCCGIVCSIRPEAVSDFQSSPHKTAGAEDLEAPVNQQSGGTVALPELTDSQGVCYVRISPLTVSCHRPTPKIVKRMGGPQREDPHKALYCGASCSLFLPTTLGPSP